MEEAATALQRPARIEHLCAALQLSPFERRLLLLCAGVELLADFSRCWTPLDGSSQRASPTFGLALVALPDPHWSAIDPSGPLRSFSLMEVGSGELLCRSPLKISESVLHYLTGAQSVDERLASLLDPRSIVPRALPASHRSLADQIVGVWSRAAPQSLPAFQLVGSKGAGRKGIVAAACQAMGYRLSALPAHALSGGREELVVARLVTREALLSRLALLIDCDGLDPSDEVRRLAVSRLVERAEGPTFLTAREHHHFGSRPMISFDVKKPLRDEQRGLWAEAIARVRPDWSVDPRSFDEPVLEETIGALVTHFDLGAAAIGAACARASASSAGAPRDPRSALWDGCRGESRPRLDALAQHIEPAATWEDLILPEPQRETLREIAVHVRQRARVYDEWGFAQKGGRGLGLSALFSGSSGTGKTLAAEVLGRELKLDVYRVDLSQIVSKYIGETEKNLRRIFDVADDGSVILLFDEADGG